MSFGDAAEGQWLSLTGSERFKNVRTEMLWTVRKGLQEGVFCVPRDGPSGYRKIWSQLQWTRFERTCDSRGPLIQLEKKDLVRARHGRSPDFADAFMLACREGRTEFAIRQCGSRGC